MTRLSWMAGLEISSLVEKSLYLIYIFFTYYHETTVNNNPFFLHLHFRL